jgi:hypothetical protein
MIFRFEVQSIDGDSVFDCETQEEFTKRFGICEWIGYSAVTTDGINRIYPANRAAEVFFEDLCAGRYNEN